MNYELEEKIYTIGGLFSGVGGIELGFTSSALKEKFKILWATDKDKFASTTYRENFKHPFYEDDIRGLKGKDLEPVDILVGGFPCQPFSIAGYRKGFHDDRGNIFFQITRLIDELPQKPKALFLENVRNIYSHDKGKTFQIIKDALADKGYCLNSYILNTAEYTPIPHNRERTFIVCFLEGRDAYMHPFAKMTTFFMQSLPFKKTTKLRPISDFLENKPVDEKYYIREDRYMFKELQKEMNKENTFYQWRRKYVRENKSGVCPALTANMGTGGHNVPLLKDEDGIRKLTPRECFNFQGFPESFVLPELADSHLYKQAGNSVTVPMVSNFAEIIYDSFENASK